MELEVGGKRYSITAGENTIGTGRGCTIAVTGDGVRSRHAIVYKSPVGAAIRATDSDAALRVNGAPVGAEPRVLRHGDTIAIGSAELTVIDLDAARSDARESGEPVMVAPSGATYRLADTMHGMPAAALQAAAPVAVVAPAGGPGGFESQGRSAGSAALASFLVRTGEQKGHRFAVRRPAALIGRASSSDVAIKDPTVSSEHALLRRKDGLWMLSDVGSTNGTYVDGERVTDESPLVPGAMVQVGDVRLMFEPYDDPVDPAALEQPAGLVHPAEARAEPLVEAPVAIEPATVAPGQAPAESPRATPTQTVLPETSPSRGWPGWVLAAVVVAAIAGAAVGFVLLR